MEMCSISLDAACQSKRLAGECATEKVMGADGIMATVRL